MNFLPTTAKSKKSLISKLDKREERQKRFQWVQQVQNGGYYCFGCKQQISTVNTPEDIHCTSKCRHSLNFGNVGGL